VRGGGVDCAVIQTWENAIKTTHTAAAAAAAALRACASSLVLTSAAAAASGVHAPSEDPAAKHMHCVDAAADAVSVASGACYRKRARIVY
jgi:hypothetical protein